MGRPGRSEKKVFLLSALLVLLLLAWRMVPPREPRYQGKTLKEWLEDGPQEAVAMPNDFYGHIHNEFWEAMVVGGSRESNDGPVSASWPAPPVEPAAAAVRAMGTNALPLLLRWISCRPGLAEKLRDRLCSWLPAGLSNHLFTNPGIPSAATHQVAALKGFEALGPAARSALPELSRLIEQPGADFTLGCAISAVGPDAVPVLVNALTNQNLDARDIAAFCLGEAQSARPEALPVLLSLVERRRASYQVLGAIGRLGGRDPKRVVPVLVRLLEASDPTAELDWPAVLSILILGRFGPEAQPAVPALVRLYQNPNPTSRQAIRVAIKHIEPERAQALLGRAPSVADDEDPWWNGPKN